MSNESFDSSENLWPIAKFYFEVEWDSQILSFEEVSGLDVEAQPIEYRHGNSPVFSTVEMPGIKKYANVTMKKGVFKSDNRFWDWFQSIKMNTFKRTPVTIRLLDETGHPTMVWILNNAWPVNISTTDLESSGDEVAIETLEIAHEGLTIANG